MTETEQSCLIRSLLTKRDDAEAQKLLDRCLSIWKRAHGYQESFFRRRGRRIALLLSVGIGLAGCTVLSVPVFSKYYTMWQQEQHPVDPGYTLDGSETIPDLYQEEHFESVEALRERYPTMQLPTIIPDGYILCDAIVYRTSGSITISIGYHKENEGALSIIIEQYNPELTKGSVNVEQNYESEEFFTYNGIEYCEVSNLERHSIFWTVREVDFDKFYSVFFPMEIDAKTRKEIVFSFE